MNMIDLVWKSVLAGGLAWGVLCLLRRHSASDRYTTMLLALVGLSALPILILGLPKWHIPLLTVKEQGTVLAASSVQGWGDSKAGSIVAHTVSAPFDPLMIIAIFWAAGASFLVLRVIYKLARLANAERRLPMANDPRLQALVAEKCRRSNRHVLLLEGLDQEPPMTWGHRRPVLVLPRDAASWPDDRLKSVLLHELAHVERGDWLGSVFCQLTCAVYWFNPFVWLLGRQMEIESETAADDRVLSQGISAIEYASHLVEVSRELSRGRRATELAMAMARPGKLDCRIRTILQGRNNRRSLRGSLTLGMAASMAACMAVLATVSPTINHTFEGTQVATSSMSKGPDVEMQVTPGFADVGDHDVDDADLSMIDESPRSVRVPSMAGKRYSSSPRKKHEQQLPKSQSVSVVTSPSLPASSLAVGDRDPDVTVSGLGPALAMVGKQIDVGTATALREFSASMMKKDGVMSSIAKASQARTQAEIKKAMKSAQVEIQAALKQIKDIPKDIQSDSSDDKD